MYKVMNRFFRPLFKFIDDYLLFELPNELSPFVINDIKENMDQCIRNTITREFLNSSLMFHCSKKLRKMQLRLVNFRKRLKI